jgi:hypothetical protein
MRFPDTAKSSVSLAFSAGLILAIGFATWKYVIVPYHTPPQRPKFANDIKSPPKPGVAIATIKPVAFAKAKPTAKATPAVDVKYAGKVNASMGLVLRAEPSQAAPSVGGADYNAKISVLKETPDREWVYIRQENTKEIGWVRSGNISR